MEPGTPFGSDTPTIPHQVPAFPRPAPAPNPFPQWRARFMQLPAWARIVLPTVAGLLTFCCVCGTCATLAQGGGNPSTVAKATATNTHTGQVLTNAPTSTSAKPTATVTGTALPTATAPLATTTPTATTATGQPTATATVKPKPTATNTPKPKPTATHTPKPSCAYTAVNGNPWCYNFTCCNTITSPPSNFCSYFNCIPSFWDNTSGYVAECNDGTYTHSGGRTGSCSSGHGGEKRALLKP